MIKGLGALTQLAMQIANAAIQPYQIEEESSEEEESDSFEVQTDNQKVMANPEEIKEEEDPEQVKLDQLLEKLGPFVSRIDMNKEAGQFTEVYCIEDWSKLMHRYKPEYMPQIKKAIALP